MTIKQKVQTLSDLYHRDATLSQEISHLLTLDVDTVDQIRIEFERGAGLPNHVSIPVTDDTFLVLHKLMDDRRSVVRELIKELEEDLTQDFIDLLDNDCHQLLTVVREY